MSKKVKRNKRGKKKLPVISIFSGALGLDLGLEAAGFEIRVAVECDRSAVATIKKNRPDLPVIAKKIEEVSIEEILEEAGLDEGEPVVVSGGPSCQTFSTVGQRGSVSDPRGQLFEEFLRIVTGVRTEFFLMENVKGMLSAAIRHRPLNQRGPGFPLLDPEEQLGSAFSEIMKALQATGYYTLFDVVNAADFGAAQLRERVIFIGSRDGRPITMPPPTHAKGPQVGEELWVTLEEGLAGLEDPDPAYVEFSPSIKRYISLVPEGGNWRDLPEEMQEEALGKAHVSWGGRVGFFRRLAWDKPSPALTTNPTSKATLLCHPDEDRPLSIAEYSRLQQFPDDWEFSGSLGSQYRQIGNAVTVCIGQAIGESIRIAKRRWKREESLGKVACASKDLIKRMAARPRTMLNPARMREVKGPEEAKVWMQSHERSRSEFLEIIVAGSESKLNDTETQRLEATQPRRRKPAA